MRALPRSFMKSVVFLPSFTLVLVLGTSFLAQSAAAQEAQAVVATPRPLISEAIDESRLTVLKGNTHPMARREYDLGTAPASLPMERMLLVLKRSDEQETALRKLLDDQQDKNSPHYHRWLTPEQFGAQFGPTDADMQTITSWLQSHGFQVGSTKGRTVLEFSGSASQVQEAFHSSIHKYIVGGEQHWANAGDPSIPTALTGAVAGVMTLHNFLKKPQYILGKEKGIITQGKHPQVTFSDGSHGLGPADYALIYNINPVYTSNITGSGITIGVIGRSEILISDYTDFQGLLPFSSNIPTIVVNGPDPGDVPGDDLEGTLDATWAQAIAPGATVDFVTSASTNTADGIDLSEFYIVDNNLANVMTKSFGICEAAVGDAQIAGTAAIAEQAAAQGISFMVSTGDAGAQGCDDPNTETAAAAFNPISVNVLASTPFTVAVGGTVFNENNQDSLYWSSTNSAGGLSVLKYIPENVWNESCLASSCGTNANIFAGGGGSSLGNTTPCCGNSVAVGTFTGFPIPSWQAEVTGLPPASNPTKRSVPDVSLTAAIHDGYVLCFQGSCASNLVYRVAGTSASAPSFAGIMALVDQKMGQVEPASGARQGQPDYVLYPLAAQETYSGCASTTPPASTCVFNDVTVGNNAVPGEVGYPSAPYNAGVGYDAASGLGSVNVANLVSKWGSMSFRPTTTTLALAPTTGITHGTTPVTVTISVAPGSGTGTPAGDVSLIASVGGNAGGPSALGPFTLDSNNGAYSGTTLLLPGGTSYQVTAHYAGNSTSTATGVFAPSDSAPVTVTVTAEASSTTVSGIDQNNTSINGRTFPFGSFLFVRADVAGTSGKGVPTGSVTFANTGTGSLPTQNLLDNPVIAVPNPSPLNSNGNTSVGAGVINFDAGTYSISASYNPNGDQSFNASSSTTPVTFTISPGFAGVSGPTDVTIASPGLSGTTTIGIVTSSGFTNQVAFTCAGLPAETTCTSSPVSGSGPNTIMNGNITVNTTAPHVTMLRSNEQRFYYAVLLSGGLPLAGVFVIGGPRRRRWSTLLGIMMVMAVLMAVPGCGGGGGSHHQQDPGTPAGTYTVTVTATGGSLSAQGTFTLIVK
jgi:subtilase family serine protease